MQKDFFRVTFSNGETEDVPVQDLLSRATKEDRLIEKVDIIQKEEE